MPELTAIDLLRTARNTLTGPTAWTQGAAARTASGYTCPATDPKATCFCAIGALLRAAGVAYLNTVIDLDPPARAAFVALNTAAGDMGCAVEVNDSPGATHADVLALYDRAIAAVEASGG